MLHSLLSFLAPGPLPGSTQPPREPQARPVRPGLRVAAAHAGRAALLTAGLLADAIGFAMLMLGCWLAVATLAVLVY